MSIFLGSGGGRSKEYDQDQLKKNQARWAHIYFRVFFHFIFSGLHFFTGEEGQIGGWGGGMFKANLIIFLQGAGGGLKQMWTKSRGVKAIFFL